MRNRGLEVTYSIVDHVRDIKRTTTKTIFFSSSDKDLLLSTAGQDTSAAGIVKFTWSPSTNYKAVLRNLDGGKKRFVEIWGRDGALILTKDVTDNHGEFYADGMGFSLSSSLVS